MPLVTTREMLKAAYAGGYAVGAFNVNNMEFVQAVSEAAAEVRSPLILQASKSARAYADPVYLKKLAEAAAEKTGLPIALHLDHGISFEICKTYVDNGFTSVMIDGSARSFEENIAVTRQVVAYAHDHGAMVEAELGTLAGAEGEISIRPEDAVYTRPEDVQAFVERTGCDSLAIAIGTSHGPFKFKPGDNPHLRLDILAEVSRRLPNFPIVLHGASSIPLEYVAMLNENGGNVKDAIGIPEPQLRRAASMAVCKINIDSDLRIAMTATVRQYLREHPETLDPYQYLGAAKQALRGMTVHKMLNVLGCGYRA